MITGESTEANPCKKNTFLVWKDAKVDNFVFTCKFRITGTSTANSGIQFRSQIEEDGHVVGYQADIDRAGNWLASIYDEKGRGSLAKCGGISAIGENGKPVPVDSSAELPESLRKLKVVDTKFLLKHINFDDWIEYKIQAIENTLVLSMNGYVTAIVIDNDISDRELSGVLALQLHSGPPMKIEFKDLKLKRLPLESGRKKVVFVAGKPSHGVKQHEHNAGCLLLEKSLSESGLPLETAVYLNGWPADPTAFDNADTLVFYADGGGRHYVNQHLAFTDQFMKAGVGLVCIHYAVEVPKGESGDHFLKWMGGYFEPYWSVNPHWTAEFDKFPEHPVTRGVEPFSINDEWYYHMRFVDNMKGVTPILSDLPPTDSLKRPDGAHSGNPHVRADVLEKKLPQHVAWAYERSHGGKGFGFTGGHFHTNWQNENFRKTVLNAIVWTANMEVPAKGVKSKKITDADLEQNLDPKGRRKPKPKKKVSERESKQVTLVSANDKKQISEAEASLNSLVVHPDLKLELFASEPMMTNPTNIDVDHLGRVWVCEVVNYRQYRNKDTPPREAGDRISVLEDTDGDGKADKSTIFYQGAIIDSAHGVCVLGNKVIVSARDKVLIFYDDNNDLKADRHEVLFAGIAGVDHDHGIHAFVYGPDGKLYFNIGNNGKHVGDKQGKILTDKAGNLVTNARKPYQEGMIFRCNPDGSEFETLAWNFRNPWEVCIDSYGYMWQSDNDDDGNRGTRINFIVEYGNYGYKDEFTGAAWRASRTGWSDVIPHRHWHLNDPGVVPNLIQTYQGSPCGIMVYEGTSLPAILHQQPLHCDPGPNVVRAYISKKTGAGYKAESINLIESKVDRWFRPVDICVAPDESLYVADWYDAGVGGHRMVDISKGRIYRLSKPGGHSFTPPDFSSTKGLLKAFKSANLATRYMARTGLMEKGNEVLPELKTMIAGDNSALAARALWLYGKIELATNQAKKERPINVVNIINTHPDTDIRCTGVKLFRQLYSSNDAAVLNRLVQTIDFVQAPAPVKRELAILLREIDIKSFAQLWGNLAMQYDGADRWYLEALGIAAEGRWNTCLPSYLKSMKGDLQNKAVKDVIWRSRADVTASLLLKLIKDDKTPITEIPRYFRALDFQTYSSDELAELAFGGSIKNEEKLSLVMKEAISRIKPDQLTKTDTYRAQIEQLLDKVKGTDTFLMLVDKFSLKNHYPDLLTMMVDHTESQLGVDAARLLLKKKQSYMFPIAIENPASIPASVKLANTLGLTEDSSATKILHQIMLNDLNAIAVRRAAVKGVGRTNQGLEMLLKIVKKDEIPAGLKQAVALVFHASKNAKFKTAGVKYFPIAAAKDSKPLAPVKVLAKRKGIAKKGMLIYFEQGTCHKCHTVNGQGKEVGPDLSEIGKKLSREALYESILFPSAGISHNYESFTILTSDGKTFNGLLVSETDSEIKLKNAEGIEKTIMVADILDKKKDDVSIMPADLHKLLTEEELVNLVEYMTTLKERKKK